MSIKQHFDAFKDAWNAETERRKAKQRDHLDTEFLPAALEIAETPPSPIGRAIIWTIIAACILALFWSIFGKIDIVAVAEGRIVPTGRLQSIEAAETGTIRSINVREGAKVKKGQPLLTLDPTFAIADVGAAIAEYNQASLAAARAKAILSYLDGGSKEISVPPETSAEALHAEMEVINSRIKAFEEKLATLSARENAAKSAILSAKANMDKAAATLSYARQQLYARQELDRKGFGAHLITLQAEERVVSLQYEIKTQREEVARASAELEMIKRERAQTKADFRAQAATELSEAETASSSRRETATKAQERAKQQVLFAPLDGTIVEVAITTIGERVEGGAPLMTLVPEGQELEVDAMVLNKDIGFIKPNQRAIIKLEAYPFTRFGYIEGTVTKIAGDSINDEKRGLIFPVSIKIDNIKNSKTKTKEEKIIIKPGLAASVEIKTGKRRIIDFILSPIAKATSEAGRER